MTAAGHDVSIVLAPYLEPLVRGRRVVVLGNATSLLASALLDRGARLVHVYDPDAVRAAQVAAQRPALRSFIVAPLPDGELAVRDGAFDAVIIPDLTLFETPDDIIARARRLVAATGAVVIASPSAEQLAPGSSAPSAALSYYELYDAVALQFPEVRMFGQAPFSGYVLADFGQEGEPDVVFDTSLLEQGAEEPSWFIAVGAQRPTRLDPYAVIQVPSGVTLTSPGVSQDQAAALRAELAVAEQRAIPLEAELARARERAKELEQKVASAARYDELLRELQERLRSADSRAGDAYVRVGQLEGKIRDLEEELRRQRERAFKLTNELEEEKKTRTRIELELGMMRRTSELPPKIDRTKELDAARRDAEQRMQGIEQQLASANHRIEQGGRELQIARARVTELESALEDASDELHDARAELKQARTRIVELERELKRRDERIQQLDDELAALSEARSEMSEQEMARLRRAEVERDVALRELAETREMQEREINILEATLLERGQEVARLRRDAAHDAELVRDLVLTVQELQGAVATGPVPQAPSGSQPLRLQLDQLAALSAAREAELQQARWKIQELEGKLAAAVQADAKVPAAELEAALFAAQHELDMLRKSLQNERNLRVRAESASEAADALAHAHADLQGQAVLVASLDASRETASG